MNNLTNQKSELLLFNIFTLVLSRNLQTQILYKTQNIYGLHL